MTDEEAIALLEVLNNLKKEVRQHLAKALLYETANPMDLEHWNKVIEQVRVALEKAERIAEMLVER